MQKYEIKEPTFTRAGVERLRLAADVSGDRARSLERIAVDENHESSAWDLHHFLNSSDVSDAAAKLWRPFRSMAHLAIAFKALRIYERHARIAADAIGNDDVHRAEAASISCSAFLTEVLRTVDRCEARLEALERPHSEP